MNCIHQINSYVKKTPGILLFVVMPWFLAGCQNSTAESSEAVNGSSSAVSAPLPEPKIATSSQTGKADDAPQGTASLCQRELIALSKVNKNTYAKKKGEFDSLLSSASVYTSVRDEIGGQTRDTMDALYKYKTQKLCNDIEQSVREALISKGENF